MAKADSPKMTNRLFKCELYLEHFFMLYMNFRALCIVSHHFIKIPGLIKRIFTNIFHTSTSTLHLAALTDVQVILFVSPRSTVWRFSAACESVLLDVSGAFCKEGDVSRQALLKAGDNHSLSQTHTLQPLDPNFSCQGSQLGHKLL